MTGGCLCGAVRYEAKGEPVFSVLRYCRDCQKASGAGHAPLVGVAKDNLTVTGPIKTFSKPGGSGKNATRHFCAECGSLILGSSDAVPALVSVSVGTLDDPSKFQPRTAIFTRSRADWDKCAMALKEFETVPPPRGGSN